MSTVIAKKSFWASVGGVETHVHRGEFADSGDAVVVAYPGMFEAVGGGGSQPIITLAKNGLVKNLDLGDLVGTRTVIFDPTAQPWQESTEYTNEGDGLGSNPNNVNGSVPAYVTPTTNPNGVKFKAQENGSAVSGAVEPVWSEDGSTPVQDGTEARPLEWEPSSVYNLWAALTAVTGTIFESGFAFASDGGGSTGAVKPDFSGATNNGDTVSDGGVTWTNQGPAYGAWAAGTRYSFRLDSPTPTSNYGQPFVIPSDAVPGTSYAFSGQPIGQFGTSGATEPAGWEDAMPSDSSIWVDGDLLWSEASSGVPTLVITGIVAPSGVALATFCDGEVAGGGGLTLEDESQVVNDYGDYAVSDAGNRFNGGGSNIAVPASGTKHAVYVDAEWGSA